MLAKNIEHILATDGIEAVLVVDTTTDTERYLAGPLWSGELTKEIMADAIALARKVERLRPEMVGTPMPTARVMLTHHTLMLERHGDEIAAVIYPTGHPLAKSIRRLLKRTASRDRGPLRRGQQPPVAAADTNIGEDRG